MDSAETQGTAQTLTERIDVINQATRGLYSAVMTLVDLAQAKEEMPPELAKITTGVATDILTLANCGLIALTEIADAQQRIAVINEQSQAIINSQNDGNQKRSFIGQQTK